MRRLSVTSLAVAYLLLVSIVVYGSWWLQREFDEAQGERCASLTVQLDIVLVQAAVAAATLTDLDILTELQGQLDAFAQEVRSDAQPFVDSCPELFRAP